MLAVARKNTCKYCMFRGERANSTLTHSKKQVNTQRERHLGVTGDGSLDTGGRGSPRTGGSNQADEEATEPAQRKHILK